MKHVPAWDPAHFLFLLCFPMEIFITNTTLIFHLFPSVPIIFLLHQPLNRRPRRPLPHRRCIFCWVQVRPVRVHKIQSGYDVEVGIEVTGNQLKGKWRDLEEDGVTDGVGDVVGREKATEGGVGDEWWIFKLPQRETDQSIRN